MKHTPGPWKRGLDGCTIYANTGVFLSKNAIKIADMDEKNKLFYADSQLIAAAPDLLEACEEMSTWWHNTFGPTSEGGNGTYAAQLRGSAVIYDKMTDAIAKSKP